MSGSSASPALIAKRLRQPPDKPRVLASKSVNPARPSVSAIREDSRSASWHRCLFKSALNRGSICFLFGANSEICATAPNLVRLRMATFPLSGFTLPDSTSFGAGSICPNHWGRSDRSGRLRTP